MEKAIFGVLRKDYRGMTLHVQGKETKFQRTVDGKLQVYDFTTEEWEDVKKYFVKTDHTGRVANG